MKKLVLPAVIAALMTGCAAFPKNYEKPVQPPDIVNEMRDAWASTPAIVYVKSEAGRVVRKHNTLPQELADKPVTLAIGPGQSLTLTELAQALQLQGYRVVSRLPSEAAGKAVLQGNFNGTLGGLLEQVSAVYNIAYEYRNNMIHLTEFNQYSATLPKHKSLVDTVLAGLKERGITKAQADLQAGKVFYLATPEQADFVEEYLQSVTTNAAMVTMQMAVLTVGLNQGVNIGFDWAKFAVKRGSGDFKPSRQTDTSSDTSSGTSSDTTSVTETAAKVGQLLSLVGGEGGGYTLVSDAFSITAAIKALSTYGNARTDQNVVMSTLSGLPVKIESGNEIPYVKSIGASTTSGGATSGSSQTEVVKSGLTIELVPNFDSIDRTVITSVNVKLATLVGFRELSAGTNLGTMSQPEMQNMSFENVGRLSAGDTLIIGGITYNQVSNNYSSFPGLEKAPVGSKATMVTRNAMYIVVRPTVVVFTPDADRLNAQLPKTPGLVQVPGGPAAEAH